MQRQGRGLESSCRAAARHVPHRELVTGVTHNDLPLVVQDLETVELLSNARSTEFTNETHIYRDATHMRTRARRGGGRHTDTQTHRNRCRHRHRHAEARRKQARTQTRKRVPGPAL